MNVVGLQLFVSLVLVAGSIVLFVHSVRERTHEHAERLSLAPLEDDAITPARAHSLQNSASNSPENEALSPAQEADTEEKVCRRDG
ncbi:MAG TPA: cytochrome oxidase [Polyangia bacterium]